MLRISGVQIGMVLSHEAPKLALHCRPVGTIRHFEQRIELRYPLPAHAASAPPTLSRRLLRRLCAFPRLRLALSPSSPSRQLRLELLVAELLHPRRCQSLRGIEQRIQIGPCEIDEPFPKAHFLGDISGRVMSLASNM